MPDGQVRCEEASSCSGDIAFSPPAEDEGAASALHHLAIDLRPERDKIIEGRGQRQKNHEPDGDNCDPVDGKNIRAYRPVFPTVVEDDGDHGNNLHQHFEFAQIAGLNGEPFRGGNRTQTTHQKLARNNHYRDPGGNQAGVELNQRDESGGDKKLIGQGIEQYAHGSDLSAPAGEIPVDPVGDGGGDKEGRSQQLLFAVKGVKMVG